MRQFIERFNNESLQLVRKSEDFLISAFINGLRHGKLYRHLISKPPPTMKSLFEQADDFALADGADRKNREETKTPDKEKGKEQQYQSGRRRVLNRLSCSNFTRAYSPKREHFTPLLKSPKEIYASQREEKSSDRLSECRIRVIKKIKITTVSITNTMVTRQMTTII